MFGLVALAFVLVSSGCSSPQSVSQMEGTGTKEIFNAGYDRVWSAAHASAQQGDLYILNADKAHGFISAKRSLQPESFGENVAIWVRHQSHANSSRSCQPSGRSAGFNHAQLGKTHPHLHRGKLKHVKAVHRRSKFGDRTS